VLVEAGTVLTPLHLAVLVAAGCERVFVYRRPLLGVITTGSELVGVDQPREDYQVRDTNSIMLTRLLLELGLDPPFVATSGDDLARLCEVIERAKRCDILVLTGGVSVGHVDLVPTALEACGFEKVFHRVAIRPGKPTLLARNGQHLAFGLPGNPVSAAVGYFLFVRATILRWVGVQDTGSLTVTAFLSEAVRQEKGRQGFHPGKLSAVETQLAVRPLPFSGSTDLASFSSADCLIVLPQDVEELPCRVPVDVLPLTGGVGNGIFSF
jgi:molybdopterin molybdotransferase